MASNTRLLTLILLLQGALLSSAAPAPDPAITPPPTAVRRAPDRTANQHERRAIDVASYVASVINGLGSSVQSYVASGVPAYFQDLPTGTAVLSSAGVSQSDIDAKPTEVLNVPAYGNWSDAGAWQVRVRGNVYKQPDIPQPKLDELANKFLIDTQVKDLPPDQQARARNVTAQIFVVQQENQEVTFDFVNDVSVVPDINGGAINAVSTYHSTFSLALVGKDIPREPECSP